MEDKVWWHTSLSMHNKQNTIEKGTKGCIFPCSKKSDLRITKIYRGLTFSAKVYNSLLFNCIQTDIEENSLEKSEWISRKLLYSLTDSDNMSNHQNSMSKESWGNTTVHRILQDIHNPIQRKDKYYLHMVSQKKLSPQ